MDKTRLLQRFGPAALVTGASDGIGRAFAEELAAAGFDLVLVARREALLKELADTLTSRHPIKVRAVAADLSQPEGIAAVLAQSKDAGIGLLVAAAGFGSSGAFLDQDVAAEANMVDVNCRAVVELVHGIGGRMQRAGRGGIVLFGSLVGFQGAPWSATYAATKGFVQSFAEGLAEEFRPHGISVLSVAPGPIRSGFGARAGMQMGMAQTPGVVAKVSLAALGASATVRPGWLSKFLGWSLGMLPRWLRVRVMGQIMKGMAQVARPVS
jgi:short-subunit dehydrogenase